MLLFVQLTSSSRAATHMRTARHAGEPEHHQMSDLKQRRVKGELICFCQFVFHGECERQI